MDRNRVVEFCEKNEVTILNRKDFPKLLSEIPDPPEELFIQGNPNVLFGSCFGIVGTRKPSTYGLRSAIHLSKALSQEGLAVVSGLARGIDSAAHKGTLLGGGKTIAVLAHGHDEIYPRDNALLAREIIEKGGAVISEYPPFTGCKKFYFVARNRIVAGLSKGVLVIEASSKSGSLITANFANDFGRDVFVVPGPYDDPNYMGSHELIQNGAKLVKSLSDILTEYPSDFFSRKKESEEEELVFYKKILNKEFSFEDLFLLALEEDFQAGERIKKWLDNKLIAEISPQHYMWLN